MKQDESDKVRNFDKSLDLVKIQIFSERAHSKLTTQITNTYAVLVGFVVLFYTLFYENVIPPTGFILGLAMFLAGTVYWIYHARRVFKKDVKRISDMIEVVKGGKELPRLEDFVG